MKKSSISNLEGELLTTVQICQLANLGTHTVRKLAEESGAIRKIGKSYRINRKIFFDFIEARCRP